MHITLLSTVSSSSVSPRQSVSTNTNFHWKCWNWYHGLHWTPVNFHFFKCIPLYDQFYLERGKPRYTNEYYIPDRYYGVHTFGQGTTNLSRGRALLYHSSTVMTSLTFVLPATKEFAIWSWHRKTVGKLAIPYYRHNGPETWHWNLQLYNDKGIFPRQLHNGTLLTPRWIRYTITLSYLTQLIFIDIRRAPTILYHSKGGNQTNSCEINNIAYVYVCVLTGVALLSQINSVSSVGRSSPWVWYPLWPPITFTASYGTWIFPKVWTLKDTKLII